MKSEANKHALRRARSRAKLIDATIAMIAEQGFPGFTLTKLGAHLGLSRGLASYHFEGGRAQVIETALAEVLDAEKQLEGLGLPALFSWIGELSQRAAAREPKLLALLQLAVGPGVEAEAPALRVAYWTRQSELIRRHLDVAQASGEIREDLELSHLAATLLGLVHGELLRIAATGDAPGPALTNIIERALAPERLAAARRASRTTPPPVPPSAAAPQAEAEPKPEPRPVQGTLFD